MGRAFGFHIIAQLVENRKRILSQMGKECLLLTSFLVKF